MAPLYSLAPLPPARLTGYPVDPEILRRRAGPITPARKIEEHEASPTAATLQMSGSRQDTRSG
jgi:hypothetical protein